MENKKTYKIEVSFSRVYDIEAETKQKAEEIALEKASKDLNNPVGTLRTAEYIPPIDWRERAEEEGLDICSDLSEEIESAVEEYTEKNGIQDIEQATDDIYESLYQDEDIPNHAHEKADGYFIYNSTDALKEAMDCIDRLDEYASGDSGLWEGKTEYWDIINIQAYDALNGAIMQYAEEKIKSCITDMLDKS